MKKKMWIVCLVLCVVWLSGCGKQEAEILKPGSYYVYYLNSEETKLVPEIYKADKKNTKKLAQELLLAMENSPKDLSLHKVKPDDVVVRNVNADDNRQLTIDFGASYKKMEPLKEILCRAAIVKMLGQIEGINFIQFYVDGQPLTGQDEKIIGFMSPDHFIDNTGRETDYYQDVSMVLYFANHDGTKLRETHVKKVYDGTVPMEQLIIEQLLAGTGVIEGLDEGYYDTIPKGTKLLKTTTKEGICYVDFNEKFLEKREGITDEVAIYSIVNSLVELSSVSKVQFTINEAPVELYGDGTKFAGFFERNLDIVQ